MSTSTYRRCPAGDCLHGEQFDPAHGTADPAVPASGDLAHDRLVTHLRTVHSVPSGEVGALMSQARTVTREDTPNPYAGLLADLRTARTT